MKINRHCIRTVPALVLLTVLIITLGFSTITSQAAENWDITIQNAATPVNLKEGDVFQPKGIIIASNPIQNVYLCITNSAGKTVADFLKTGIQAQRFDLSQAKVDLTSLPAGTYIFGVAVRDTAGNRKDLVKTTFQIAPLSNLTITDANSPVNLKETHRFQPQGMITSNYDLENVFVAVYNDQGTEMVSWMRTNVQGKQFNLNQATLDLTQLPAGQYYRYVVAVRDKVAKKSLVDVTFRVLPYSTMTLQNVDHPASIEEGQALPVSGTIRSNYNITTCYAAIYDANGTLIKDRVAEPNSKSFDLQTMAIHTEPLPAGTYTYRLAARDQVEKKTLLDFSFTINLDTYTAKVNAFLADPRFAHGSTYSSNQTPYFTGPIAWGCCAYATDFAISVHNQPNLHAGSTRFYDINEVKDGDVLHLNRPHWIVVLKREGQQLWVAEGNWANKVRVSYAYSIVDGTLYRDGRRAPYGFVYGLHF